MLNKSRYSSAASQRQYDIPGASLRGPYKRWIPQSDSRFSESETDAPKPSLHRPSGHPGSSSHVVLTDTSHAAPSSHSRYPNGSSNLNHAPVPRTHRSERSLYGYSSESTVHASPPPAKSSSSGFGIFKPHVKDSRNNPNSSSRRERLPRSTIVSVTPTSKYPTQPLPISQTRTSRDGSGEASHGIFGSLSSQTSTDDSPRTSTDSGPRSGHASAPAVETYELPKHGHAIWHPSSGVKHSPPHPEAAKRDDTKINVKEDMVARVTEALEGGSTGKAKVVENAILQNHLDPVKSDDVSSTRRTTSSTTSRIAESRTQPQAPPMLRRHKATPQATPLHSNSHLPDVTSKSSRPSTNGSRGNPDTHVRMQSPADAPNKHAPPTPKLSTTSTTFTTKLPHSRTASSPWPFNQALPTEPAAPKPQLPKSTTWRSLSRFNASVTTTKPADIRSSSKGGSSDHISYPTVSEPARSLQAAQAPSPPTKPLPRSTSSRTATSRTDPSASASAPFQSNHNARSRYEGSPSYATPSTEQSSQRWMPPSATSSSKPTPSTNVILQFSNTSSTNQSFKAPDHDAMESAATTDSDEQHATHHAQVFVSNAQNQPALGRPSVSQLDGMSQSLWPTASRHKRGDSTDSAPDVVLERWTVDSTRSASTAAHIQAVPARSTPITVSTQHFQDTSQSSWPAPSKYADSTAATPAGIDSTMGRSATSPPQRPHLPPAGTWTSAANVSAFSSESMDDASRGLVTGTAAQPSQSALRSNPPTPPEDDTAGKSGINDSTKPASERHVAGAWKSKYLNANLSTTTLENLSTPKPPPKQFIFDAATTATSKYTPDNGDMAGKGLRSQGTNPVSAVVPTAAGAWTTGSRYATNTSMSIFEGLNSKCQNHSNNGQEISATMRQATLATTQVPGAWTTKPTTGAMSSTSDPTAKQTPPRNPSPPPPSLLKLTPPSGTGTGSNTPSSGQTSDINLTSVHVHSISTRVPISGHPSTPAPVRPVLRPTPPPLSISSTLPDTDSLLTPSSLDSPKSTMMLPQSQPVATITPLSATPDKDKSQRKGFFNFLRPKPPVYEVWMPPGHNPKDKARRRDESDQNPVPSPAKSKTSTSVPAVRPQSPKIFSPFRLFSKRHRTVSSASLDVLVGNATNTVVNSSPASSMRADTPGAPPSPPLRDAILATQEWRNKEATYLIVSGRKRRHPPGVTFDCPEDIAPADIIPSRLRVTRMLEDVDND